MMSRLTRPFRFESRLTRKTMRALEVSTGVLTLALIAASFASFAQAAPIIYPAKGQPPTLQDKDRFECYEWARAQSGFDPVQPNAQAAQQQPADPNAAPSLAGMARGAAGGAAVAELTDHSAGKGAAAGALGAAVFERARAQQAAAARQQQASQQQSARRSTYERAFGACMEARGYVVR